MLSVTAGVAQPIALARSLDLDPQLFLDAISGGAFPVDGGLKDLSLIAAAAEIGVDSSIIAAIRQAVLRASDRGHGHEDLAAVYFGISADG